MKQMEKIKADIEALSQEDFGMLRKWIAQKDWQLWEQQIEKDSAEGRLDFLLGEAMAAKAQGQLKEL
ncbi:MAG: hypothetical protein AAFR58_05465 [Cyanobacteria bacterium J06627_28]